MESIPAEFSTKLTAPEQSYPEAEKLAWPPPHM